MKTEDPHTVSDVQMVVLLFYGLSSFSGRNALTQVITLDRVLCATLKRCHKNNSEVSIFKY